MAIMPPPHKEIEMALLKFGKPETKTSRKDKHVYASSPILVNDIPVGYVVKHSEVLYGVGLPHPEKKGLTWRQFASREDTLAFVKQNAEKALRFKTAQSPQEPATGVLGL